MSPSLSGSSAVRRFKRGDVIEIRDGITFDLYTRLPHTADVCEDYFMHMLAGWQVSIAIYVPVFLLPMM